MGKHLMWLGCLVVVALVVACSSDAASEGQVVWVTTSDFQGSGTFEVIEGGEAFGCTEGSVQVLEINFDAVLDIATDLEELYSCESGDRTGTFTVSSIVDNPDPDNPTYTWSFTGATGDFVGLQGAGNGSTELAEDHATTTISGEFEFSS